MTRSVKSRQKNQFSKQIGNYFLRVIQLLGRYQTDKIQGITIQSGPIDQNKIVGAVLLDFSKALDCIPYDLLIAKLNSYSFDKEAVLKSEACINNEYRSFLKVVSGVPQGSVLDALLLGVFLSDFFLFINKSSLYNHTDKNYQPIHQKYFSNCLTYLLKNLKPP